MRDAEGPRGFGQGGPVGVSRYETLLRRLFQVKGRVAPMIDPKISPSLEVDSSRVEYGWLRGEMPAQLFATVAPVAAQFGLISLYPGATAPGQLFTLQRLTFSASAATGVRIRIDARLAGAILANSTGVRDARWVPSVPQLVPYTANNAAQQITQEYVSIGLAANTMIELPWEYVLVGGGQSLNFECDTVNVRLTINALFTERACEASEL